MDTDKLIKEILTYEERLVESTRDAVVGIYNPVNKGYGSGSHIGDGYILTNCHVVSERLQPASRVQIEWPKNEGREKEISMGHVIFNAPAFDLAIVRDSSKSNYTKPKLTLESERYVKQGTKVCVIGCPLRYFNTTTFGHITSTHRELNYYDMSNAMQAMFYQTDAAINGGNSGGACVNYNGYLIGVPSAGVTGADNIGFVIKTESIIEFIEEASKKSRDLDLLTLHTVMAKSIHK